MIRSKQYLSKFPRVQAIRFTGTGAQRAEVRAIVEEWLIGTRDSVYWDSALDRLVLRAATGELTNVPIDGYIIRTERGTIFTLPRATFEKLYGEAEAPKDAR